MTHKPEIGGYPQSFSTVNPDHRELYATGPTVSRKRQEDHCQNAEDATHTHTSGAIYCVCLSCVVEIFALTLLSGDKHGDLSAECVRAELALRLRSIIMD